jgi:hypothetical protein
MASLTLEELRETLSDEIRQIRSGHSTPAKANAIANVGGKILSSVKLEMEYARLTGRRLSIPLLDDGTGEPGEKEKAKS